jgi:preprotein translocase SecE subunit
VARDRQRSKQRRRRPAQDGGAAARPRARDVARDETIGAPDPLDHASAEVDEARLAEAGAELDAPTDDADAPDRIYADELTDEDFAAAPDEAEETETLPARRRALEPDAAAHRRPAEHEGGNRVINFLRACWTELQRVQWPDRKHVFQATAVVLGFVLIAGGWLGLMDAIWQPLINAIL